jgi:hypothetical protein
MLVRTLICKRYYWVSNINNITDKLKLLNNNICPELRYILEKQAIKLKECTNSIEKQKKEIENIELQITNIYENLNNIFSKFSN